MAELVDSYTKLLYHFDGDDGAQVDIDYSGFNHVPTFVGTAELDTAQKVFGQSSLLLDGNSDWLTVPDSPDWILGSEFTIDMRVRFDTFPGDQARAILVTQIGGLHWYFNVWNNGGTINLDFQQQAAGVLIHASTMVVDTWYHIALTRDSSDDWRTFQDGVLLGTTNDAYVIPDVAADLEIGAIAGGSLVHGWMDEFRISKGVARWTANFTPPPYPYHKIAKTQVF